MRHGTPSRTRGSPTSPSRQCHTITKILNDWPKREIILIGDSGEQDPEAYGEIAREFPERIKHIYIRSARENDDPESDRYHQATQEQKLGQ